MVPSRAGGTKKFFLERKRVLIETIFLLILVCAVAIVVAGIKWRSSGLMAFAGVLFVVSFVLLNLPGQGIEKDYGDHVRYLGDGNYSVDQNTGFLNAQNDSGLFVLSYTFLAVGLGLLVFGLASAFSSKKGKGE